MRSLVSTTTLLTGAALCLAAVACGGESAPSKPADGGASKPPADAAAARTDAPGPHPATVKGLENQLTALIAAATGSDAALIEAHTAALTLPAADEWFRDRFGAKRARKMVADYKPLADNIIQIASLLAKLTGEGLTELTVSKHEKVDDLEAVGYQTRVLKAMLITDPLYSVRLASKDGKKVFHLWSFVHAAERFRYIGKLKRIAKPDMLGELDLNEFRPTDAAKLRASANSAP